MEKPKGTIFLAQSEDVPVGAWSVAHIKDEAIETFVTGDYGDAPMAFPALVHLANQGINPYLITNPADEVVLPTNLGKVEDDDN